MSLDEFKSKVSKLANKFELNEYKYKNQNYNEEELKTEFLNPMFKSLGWDVNNELNLAPQYKEVVFEDSIKVGDKSRAPDYCFRLGGNRIFFLEAKKPYVKIESDKSPAFQTRRYGWSAQLKCSVLSDFEHLAIYETQHKPKQSENASIGRLKLYHYRDYVEKAEEIYNILSKEAVMKGCFDNFFDDVKIQKGTSSVDAEFLKEIDDWRLKLARNIALRNKDLSIEDLNYAVQLIIDRIIFFRIAEDKGIEKYKTLFNLLESENIYENFCKLCKKADAKYNSGLFHFYKETENDTTLDTFTLDLAIDNSVFKEIFINLYYPNSPYEFSVISPEILGNVYEQFLGKIIRLTPSHQAKVEEKPEVKKAGGVYYTPQYIVEYIVENTVGELLKGKTPNKVSKIKILDPACGSGSFLLGAYTYLLDWHLEYYTNLERPPKNVIYQSKKGDWNLTIQEKKRILLNNIYGVDIDYLAVEVTKLSLLLKVLEDTNKDLLEAQQKLIPERVLPNLGDNIKCGNSLVGTDILEEDLSFDEITKINPFDWESEFAFGGEFSFDVVIGNPPYVRIQNLNETLKESYTLFYKNIISGNYDLYILFIKLGYDLLKSNGRLGYILPNKFFTTNYGHKIRKYILEHKCIDKIIDFKTNQIFKNATTYTCLLFLSNNQNNEFNYVSFELGDNTHDLKKLNYDKIKIDMLDSDSWSFTNDETRLVLDKIKKCPWNFNNFSEKIFKGSSTGNDKVFLFDYVSEDSNYYYVDSKVKKNLKLEKKLLKPFINGRDVKKYEKPVCNKLLLFPYYKKEGKMELMPINILKENCPLIYSYLDEFRVLLKERKIKRMDNKNFYK